MEGLGVGKFAGEFMEWTMKFLEDKTTNDRLFGMLSRVFKLTAIRTVSLPLQKGSARLPVSYSVSS